MDELSIDITPFFDVYVHDRQTGKTTLISADSAGMKGNGNSETPAFSNDGRFVVFDSDADNLVDGDTNGLFDVFVYDRATGFTSRASIDSA